MHSNLIDLLSTQSCLTFSHFLASVTSPMLINNSLSSPNCFLMYFNFTCLQHCLFVNQRNLRVYSCMICFFCLALFPIFKLSLHLQLLHKISTPGYWLNNLSSNAVTDAFSVYINQELKVHVSPDKSLGLLET